jgi:hypothetical protein
MADLEDTLRQLAREADGEAARRGLEALEPELNQRPDLDALRAATHAAIAARLCGDAMRALNGRNAALAKLIQKADYDGVTALLEELRVDMAARREGLKFAGPAGEKILMEAEITAAKARHQPDEKIVDLATRRGARSEAQQEESLRAQAEAMRAMAAKHALAESDRVWLPRLRGLSIPTDLPEDPEDRTRVWAQVLEARRLLADLRRVDPPRSEALAAAEAALVAALARFSPLHS